MLAPTFQTIKFNFFLCFSCRLSKFSQLILSRGWGGRGGRGISFAIKPSTRRRKQQKHKIEVTQYPSLDRERLLLLGRKFFSRSEVAFNLHSRSFHRERFSRWRWWEELFRVGWLKNCQKLIPGWSVECRRWMERIFKSPSQSTSDSLYAPLMDESSKTLIAFYVESQLGLLSFRQEINDW